MLFKLSAVALFMASSVVAFPSFIHSERLAPIVTSADADIVPDSYFVVFKSGVRVQDHSAWVQSLHKRDLSVNGIWDSFTNGIKHVYDMDSFQGIAGRFRPDVLEEIRKNPD
ncbi:serine protease, partial [Modicella reniformis]